MQLVRLVVCESMHQGTVLDQAMADFRMQSSMVILTNINSLSATQNIFLCMPTSIGLSQASILGGSVVITDHVLAHVRDVM